MLKDVGLANSYQAQIDTDASNNNSSHNNVDSAVIMTKVIARVHPVHLMNVD